MIDSGSQDATLAICKEFGATVFTRPFDFHSNQKNFGLLKVSRPWVLCIDADEELNPELCRGIATVCLGGDFSKCYRLRRRLHFQGKLLRFGKTADRPLRLFPLGSATFHGTIHEELKPVDKVEQTLGDGYLIHRSYRDLTDYFVKFNKYTTRVAERHFEEGHRTPTFGFLALRPLSDFVSRYFLRLGFLDGYAGYAYALISSTYAFVKYAKLVEMTKFSAPRHPIAPPLPGSP